MTSIQLTEELNILRKEKGLQTKFKHDNVLNMIKNCFKDIEIIKEKNKDGKETVYCELTEEQTRILTDNFLELLNMKKYFNYHKHTYYSNINTTDCVVSYSEYVQRSLELGHEWLSSTEHGGTFAWIETYNKSKDSGLKFIHGGEFYFVPYRNEETLKTVRFRGGTFCGYTDDTIYTEEKYMKDNSNYHLILIAKTRNAMKELNYIMSESYDTGYYYKPRVDIELLKGLPKGEVYCTSACIGGFLRDYPKTKNILEEFIDIFGKDNFFLEVQPHMVKKQINYNLMLKDIAKEYGLKLIAGVDSHMIKNDDSILRDYLLHSKGIIYEDEEGWTCDYPDYQTLKSRFMQQGIWSEDEVEEFIDNTLILTNTEDIKIDTSMKVPTIFPDKSRDWRLAHLKKLIFDRWNEYKKHRVRKNNREKYVKEILAEYSVIEETCTEDYFLLNYYIIRRGLELGGVLTKTGRGCFLPDTLVWTKDGYKKIKDVKIGDTVINQLGEFDTVINTLKYDVDESLLKIHSIGNKDIVLTKDHRVYVYDSDKDEFLYKKAIDIIPGRDYLTTPTNMSSNVNSIDYYDMSMYSNNYFDDNVVYEKVLGSNNLKEDKLSPTYMSKNNIAGTMTNWKYRKGLLKEDSQIYNNIFNYTKMTPIQYDNYIKNIIHTNKIKRFIKNDAELLFIVGFILGDGHIRTGRDNNEISLYLQKSGKKDMVAKPRILNFLEKYDIPYSIHTAQNNKDMIIISIKSKTFKRFIIKEYEIYDNNKEKYIDIPKIISCHNKETLEGLLEGLIYSDGSFDRSKDCVNQRYTFDNSSKNLVSLFNILSYIVLNKPLSRTIDNRSKKINIKSRTCRRGYFVKNNYICSKVYNIKETEQYKGFVYDLTIKNNPSFMVENSIVHNSGASYLINFMLGFTSIDRLKHKIPMLRERFMGKARILNGSMPDIDFNVWNREAFIQAQDELLGVHGNYFMTAYGTLGIKSAFKMLCRAKNIPIEIADEVTKLINAYEKDKKHDEDLKLEDYISNPKYLELIEESKVYTGIIDSFSVSPCSFVLFNGDLRREFGLIKDKNGNLMCCVTGVEAEKLGYLKNDLLIVKVVGMNDELYKRVNIKQPDSEDLEESIKNDKLVWDLYANGLTQCLNQMESSGTTDKSTKFKPKTLEELCAFVSIIRPATASIYKSFEKREDFKYNIKELDETLRGEYLNGSWMIYQEQIMVLLQHLGFPDNETYTIMKAISKKKENVIKNIKPRFEESLAKIIIKDILNRK